MSNRLSTTKREGFKTILPFATEQEALNATEDNLVMSPVRVSKYVEENTVSEINWSSITSKPSTFTPSSHNHGGGDITSAVDNATTAANCSREIVNGNGMNFTGGALTTNRTIALGTPSTLNALTTNDVSTSSHTHDLGITVSTSDPSGGVNGDIWMTY